MSPVSTWACSHRLILRVVLVIGVLFFCVSYFLVRTPHFIVLSWAYSTSNVFSYGTGSPNTLSVIKINVLLLTCLLLSIFESFRRDLNEAKVHGFRVTS